MEPDRWNCCGSLCALAKDDIIHYLAPIRNLLRMETMNTEGRIDNNMMVTLCAMCYNTLKRANLTANSDPEKLMKINNFLCEETTKYNGGTKVFHFLQILREYGWDNVEKRVELPLKGLNVAPYYGCLLLRPRSIGIDDPMHPTVMEDLFSSLGANVIDFFFKQKCCGSYQTVHMKNIVADLGHKILSYAEVAGADIVATACPLCEFNLGPRQEEVKKQYPDFDSIPVVYFTQLMALAFGLDENATAFDGNIPDPRPLLKEKGFIQEEI